MKRLFLSLLGGVMIGLLLAAPPSLAQQIMTPPGAEDLEAGTKAIFELNLPKAEFHWCRAAQRVQASPDTYYLCAIVRLELGEWEKAKAPLQKYVELATESDPERAWGIEALKALKNGQSPPRPKSTPLNQGATP